MLEMFVKASLIVCICNQWSQPTSTHDQLYFTQLTHSSSMWSASQSGELKCL